VALQARNAAQQAVISMLQARIAELERQLGLNSGKPPSSDGLGETEQNGLARLRSGAGRTPGCCSAWWSVPKGARPVRLISPEPFDTWAFSAA